MHVALHVHVTAEQCPDFQSSRSGWFGFGGGEVGDRGGGGALFSLLYFVS